MSILTESCVFVT